MWDNSLPCTSYCLLKSWDRTDSTCLSHYSLLLFSLMPPCMPLRKRCGYSRSGIIRGLNVTKKEKAVVTRDPEPIILSIFWGHCKCLETQNIMQFRLSALGSKTGLLMYTEGRVKRSVCSTTPAIKKFLTRKIPHHWQTNRRISFIWYQLVKLLVLANTLLLLVHVSNS
jgi:hypothetical protein